MAFSGNGLSLGNIGVAVGGQGGGGANAGDVVIDWSGDKITTSGAQSLGLYAASTGGSGGVAVWISTAPAEAWRPCRSV